jgi:hypothetical protein
MFMPAIAAGQASLSGVARDTGGGALPGVTVEAASPALIEKVRTAVTNGSGQYRLTELPPGRYTVSFTLPGFATVRRPDVEVSGNRVITINADMRIGAVQETITVSGETPVVDVQSATRGQVLTDEVIKSLPATRGYNALIMLIPSVTDGSNQIDLMPAMRVFNSHGGRGNEGRVQVDGLNVGAAFNGGGVSGYVMDTANAAEVQTTVSGGLGEAEVGGLSMNIIPKSGGNSYEGSFFVSTAGEWSQGSNIDAELESFGITDPNALIKNWDYSNAGGGPIQRDRLWFFGTFRDFGAHQNIPGMFWNRNTGDPNAWSYDPDPSIVARGANSKTIANLRLTTQFGSRHKVGLFYDNQENCDGSALLIDADNCRARGTDWVGNGSGTSAPEAASGGTGGVGAAGYQDSFQRVVQTTYTAPLTDQLLVEAGFSSYYSRWGWMDPPGAVLDLNQVQDTDLGITYRAMDWHFNGANWPLNWRAATSYVTGSHAMKFGYQHGYDIDDRTNRYNHTRLNYRFDAGVPNRFTMRAGDWEISNRTQHYSLYAQDQWTVRRLTLQGAVRYERAWSWFPEGQGGGADTFRPEAVRFGRVEGVPGFNDILFRGGLAYDVFGTGRTALKVHAGQYLQAANNQDRYVVGNPANSFAQTTNRNWVDGNGNYQPDCDLMNPAAQDNRGSGGDFCSQWLTPNFGSPTSVSEVNPAILEGWGNRPSDRQYSVAIQHEVIPRVSAELSYHHRTFHGFTVTDNRALGPDDFDQFTITAPADPRLPGGGGYQATYAAPNRVVASDNYVTFASDYGDMSQYWQGFDTNVNARLGNGLVLQGGTSTGRGVRDDCEVQAALPETIGSAQVSACRVTEPFLTTFRGLASYTVPIIDVQLSAGLQFKPGIGNVGGNASASTGDSLNANWFAPSSVVVPALGRPIVGGGAGMTLNLVEPGDLYGERINQVDLRIGKILRFGGTRTLVGIDLYNLFNANPGISFNESYGTNYLRPTNILMPRFVRFNATVDF